MAKADLLFFEIWHWVAFVADDWTPEDAERLLNTLRQQTRDMVRANQANKPNWVTLAFAGRSETATLRTKSGKVYLTEAVTLAATVGQGQDPQAAQDAILALMKAHLTSGQGVYGYQRDVEDFGSESPVSYVASAGADFSGALNFGR